MLDNQPDPLTESLIAQWQTGYEAATATPEPTELADTFANFFTENYNR